MAVYSYRARNQSSGRLVAGTAEVESRRELVESLRQAGYIPLAVTGEGPLSRLARRLGSVQSLGLQELAVFYRQLAP